MAPVKHPLEFERLVALAKPVAYDPERSLKDQLRAVEALQRQSKEAEELLDLENAYVYLGRAATVALDYLPLHSQYDMMTQKQQSELSKVR